MKNKYGLSRNIPPNIKYQIRKDAYFGCVRCGVAIVEYEHIDPEYSQAKEHDPSKMTLLCPTCHTKVTQNFSTKKLVWDWKKNPYGKINGNCHSSFDIDSDNFFVWLSGSKFENFEKLITIEDVCILSIKTPEKKGSPFMLSGLFYDDNGNKILEIIDNEWIAESNVFDVVCSAGKIGIRQDGKFVLKIICFLPNQIVIETIDMYYKKYRITGNQNQLKITTPTGQEIQLMSGNLFKTNTIGTSGFYLSQNGLQVPGTGINCSPLMEKIPTRPLTRNKCGQNEPCPCESNKKYKKCCYPKYDFIM